VRHLKIKNAIFLNKAIRKLHSKRGQMIRFTDVVDGDIDDIRANIHCDASLMNVAGSKSQIGVCAMITSKSEENMYPKNTFGKAEMELVREIAKRKPFIKCTPIMWGSWKSHRVATSSYGSELQAVFAAFDAGTVLRQLMSELMYGHSFGKIQVDVRNDNLSLVNSINAITRITQEKRLTATLMSLREMLKKNEIESVGFIPGTTNLADCLTKATSGSDIQLLLTENKCSMFSKEEKKEKMYKVAADKQYLLVDHEYKKQKWNLSQKVKEKFNN